MPPGRGVQVRFQGGLGDLPHHDRGGKADHRHSRHSWETIRLKERPLVRRISLFLGISGQSS